MFRVWNQRPRRAKTIDRSHHLRLETLETRNLLSTFNVTSVSDSGTGSLRQAILDSNASPAGGSGTNTIDFAISGLGTQKITLVSSLPPVTATVVIDGYTQAGSTMNSNPIDQPDNAVIKIQIDGNSGDFTQGLTLSANDCTVRGLSFTGFSGSEASGIVIGTSSSGDLVAGNYIGPDPTGGAPVLNNQFGVYVQGPDSVIGGLDPADRNVISANHEYGVYVSGASASNTLVEGNFIGMKADGNSAYPLGNLETPIVIDQADHTTIGGTTAQARNLLAGVPDIMLTSATNTTIQGNYLGLDRTGTNPVYSGAGIDMSGCTNTLIGGTAAGSGNIIGNISVAGEVAINNDLASNLTIQGNDIGVTPTGKQISTFSFGVYTQRSTNTLIGGTAAGAGNVIADMISGSNQGYSVYLAPGGTPAPYAVIEGNSFYGDDGPAIGSSTVNAPVLTGATSSTVTGHLTAVIGSTYRVEYFVTPDTGGASNQQAETFVGAQDNLTPDSSGQIPLSFSPQGGFAQGEFITATATQDGTSTSGTSTGIKISQNTSADLGVSVLGSPNPVEVGGNITYTITVSNGGPDPALNSTLATSIPKGSTFVSFTGPSGWNLSAPAVGGTGNVSAGNSSLASGSQSVFTLVVNVSSLPADGAAIAMSANVSSSTNVLNPANETASTSTNVQQPLVTTVTSLTAAPNPLNVGSPVPLVAHVTSRNGQVPVGNVIFLEDSKTLGQGTVDANGNASVFVVLGAGPHILVADYVGNSGFGPSSATTTAVIVKPSIVGPGKPSIVGPEVTRLQRFASHKRPTALELDFNAALDAGSAQNVGNYTITTSSGRIIPVKAAIYDPSLNRVFLYSSRRLSNHRTYHLRVNGSTTAGLRGADGALIDGAGDHISGTDYLATINLKTLHLDQASGVTLAPPHGPNHSHPTPKHGDDD